MGVWLWSLGCLLPTLIEGPELPEHSKGKGPQQPVPSGCHAHIKEKKKLSKWRRDVDNPQV